MFLVRAGRFAADIARHAVPVGGIFARDWHPITGIAVYWLESLFLALVAAMLCLLLQRRTSAAVRGAAVRDGDDEAVRAIDAERAHLQAAHIAPNDVLLFHVGSLGVFGAFLGGLLFIMVSKGHVPTPVPWGEVGEAALAMGLTIAVGFLFDLWRFDRTSVADVRARVDACTSRWALLWLLGFVGTAFIVFLGRPLVFFTLFAGLKILFESWARLARLFGWRSLKDRAADRVNAV